MNIVDKVTLFNDASFTLEELISRLASVTDIDIRDVVFVMDGGDYNCELAVTFSREETEEEELLRKLNEKKEKIKREAETEKDLVRKRKQLEKLKKELGEK